MAPSDIYDLACIGFGPASLAIAVALHDMGIDARVIFLERQKKFAWHSGMLLPGTRMQISFMKDMATFRDPSSQFTFLNYLHSKGRLVAFANLSTFYPLREEFNDYLTWCASHFQDQVCYGKETICVAPVTGKSGMVESWQVVSRDVISGETTKIVARHVIVAAGGRPRISPSVPRNLLGDKIIHSSQYAERISRMDPDSNQKLELAVVGGGQSAAEVFEDLSLRYPNANVTLYLNGSALKPSDDSPFVNEIFDPERVDNFFSLPEEKRHESLQENRQTNYSVVRPELLDRLYEHMYQQRLHNPDERTWRTRIVPFHELSDVDQKNEELHLVFKDNRNSGFEETNASLDLVVLATGYTRNAHETLLDPVRHLLTTGRYDVRRDYTVRFKEDKVSDNCSIRLQGCCEQTHGLSDGLLSILAVRGGEIVKSIFCRGFGKREVYPELTAKL